MSCPASRRPMGRKCPDDWPFYRSMNDGETMCCYKYTRDTSYLGKKYSTQLKGRLTRIRNLKVDIINTEVKLSNSKRKALTLSKKLKEALLKLVAGGRNVSVLEGLEKNLQQDQDKLNNLNQQLQEQLKKCREEYTIAKQDAATSNEKNQITEQKLAEIEAIYQKKLAELQNLVERQREEIAAHVAKMTQMSDKIIQTDVGMRELSDLQEQLKKLNLERIDLINQLGDKDLKLAELDKAKKLCDESIAKNRDRLASLENEIRDLDQKYRQEKEESDKLIQKLESDLKSLETERDSLRDEAKKIQGRLEEVGKKTSDTVTITSELKSLRERISELDDEVNQKRVELAALQRLNQEFENKLRTCTEDKSNIEKRLADMTENYNKNLSDLQRLKDTIIRLETEVARLRKVTEPVTGTKELSDLRAERDALLLERDDLRSRLKGMTDPSQLQKLEKELEAKNNQITDLNRDIDSLRKELQSSQDNGRQLEQRVRELEASLAKHEKLLQETELLRRTIDERTRERDENLKRLNETLEKLTALQAQLTGTDQLSLDLTTVRQQLENEKQDRLRLEAELISLRAELNAEKAITATLKTANQTLQSEVDSLKEELEALKKMHLEKDATVEKGSSEVSRLRSQLEQLERDKQELTLEVERLRAENQDRLSVITDLQEKLKTFEGITPQGYRDTLAQVDRLTQDNTRLTRDLSDLQLKYDNVLRDLETLRQQLSEETGKLRPSEDRIAELTSRLSELTKIKGDLEAQLIDFQTTKDRLRDSETRNADLSQKVDDLTRENARLNTELATLRDTVEAEKRFLQDEISTLKRQLGDKSLTENEISQLREQLKLMQTMKAELDSKSTQIAGLEGRISQLENELKLCQEREAAGKDVSAQVEVLRQQLAEMTKQKETLENDLRETREQLSQSQAKHTEHEETIGKLRQENAGLMSQIGTLKSEVDEERRRLTDELTALKEQLKTSDLTRQERDQLRAEKSSLETQLKELKSLQAQVGKLQADLKSCLEEKERTGRDSVQKLAQLETQVKDLQEKLRQKLETEARVADEKRRLEEIKEIEEKRQEELRLQLKTAELKLEANVIGRYELSAEPTTDRIRETSEKLGGKDVTTVEGLVETYCNYITQKLLTPAMVKISSLSLIEMRTILEDKNVSLSLNKEDLARSLPEYLYIDIKNVREVNSSYYQKHFQPIQEYIDRDTKNVNTYDTNKSGLYVYAGRFCKRLLESHSDTDRSAREMRTTMAYYLIDNVESVLRFGKLEEDLNSPENVNFRDTLDSKLREKVSGNVLTYLKIRNDDGSEWNRRFQVGVNDRNRSLLVKYNSHNIPYYGQDKKPLAKAQLDQNLAVIGMSEKSGHYPSNFERTGAPSKYDHTYVVGPLTDVFAQNVSNREIAGKLDNVITNLENQIPVFIIGYGASGAGKTSTLIYLKNGDQEGILVHLCNLMAKKGYTNLTMKAYEFYRKVGETKTTTRETKDLNFNYTGSSFYLTGNYTHTNTFAQEPTKEFTPDNKMSEVMIYLIDEDRYVKATTNNPNSSRSHALVFVELRDSTGKVSQLVVGDFAGVENIFNCDNDDVIGRFLNIKRGDGRRFYSDFKSPGDRTYEYPKETCRKDVNKDEDLYIFSEKTPIRGKDRYNPYYQSNYHTVMKRLAEVTLQVTGSRSEGDVFERVKREVRDWSKVDERVVNDVKVAESILTSFRDAMKTLPKGSIEIKKVLYKKVIETLGLEYAYTRDLVTDDVIKAFEADLEKVPEKVPKNISVLVQKLQIESLADMSRVVTKKMLEQRDTIRNIYDSKSNYMSSFLNGDVPVDSFNELKICGGKGNILTQYSGNPLGETKAIKYRQNIKAFKAWSTVKCDNISNSQEFIKAWNTLFTENVVLSSLITGLAEGQNPFPTIWSRLTELYDDNFSYIIDLENYTRVYNDLKSLVIETNCRMDYGKTVCEIRRNEGLMINDSLRTVRNTIRKILIEKNKDNINISPAFVDACLDMYCSDKGCFDLGESKDESDLIFNVIRDRLRDSYSRLVVGVFCVLNLSKAANNPPPVPYIDINSLWYRVNKFSPDKFIRGLNAKKTETEFYKRAKSVIKTITSMSDKVSDLIASAEFTTFRQVVNDIESGTLTVEDHGNIIKFLEYVDKINAASAIGTLQFVDSLAKYNSVKAMCDLDEPDIAHRPVQFTYKNIVTNEQVTR